mgnify:CR=1 FL=1
MNARKIILAAIALGALALAAWRLWGGGEYEIVNAHPRGAHIIAFGDSLTAGYGADKGRDYVSLLSQRFGVPVLNKGRAGDTTAEALARLEADVLRQDPRIVIVFLGGNDYLRRGSVDEAFANLETIISRIQGQGALAILVGMKSPLGQYEGRYRALARRMGCPYVPNVMKDVLGNRARMTDATHPNNAGYAILAERIGDVLARHL